MSSKKEPEEGKPPNNQEAESLPHPSPKADKPHPANDLQEKDEWINETLVPEEDQSEPSESSGFSLGPVSPDQARTWAALAHLSILLNLITGWFGIAAALIIYLIYKDRSRLVAYHAMQSMIFQAITWLGSGIIAGICISVASALSFLIFPLLLLIPGFLVLLLMPASLIYGVIGAVKVNNEEDFRYWQVGDWVRGILEPKTNSTENK